MTDVPNALVDRIAQAIGDPGSILPRNDGESITRWSTRAVLAVWDDLPAAHPTVDRDALVAWLHEHASGHQTWPCRYDKCGHLNRAVELADALLASGVLADAAQVRADARRGVAEEIAAAIEAARDRFGVGHEYDLGVKQGMNDAARIAREAARADTEEADRHGA